MSELDDSSRPPSPASSKPKPSTTATPGPRLAMWSIRDPVIVLGAVRSAAAGMR